MKEEKGKKLRKQNWISLPRLHLREDRMNDKEKCRLKGSFLSMGSKQLGE